MARDAVKQEKKTFGEIISGAASLGMKHGKVGVKDLQKQLHIEYPTAVKAVCALFAAGLIGERIKKDHAYVSDKTKERALFDGCAKCGDYLPFVEGDADADKLDTYSYMEGVFLPALKMALMFGSVSIIFLQRKLGVVTERANELFDLMQAAGLLGEEDFYNPGRVQVRFTHADYDRIALSMEALK